MQELQIGGKRENLHDQEDAPFEEALAFYHKNQKSQTGNDDEGYTGYKNYAEDSDWSGNLP